MITCIFENNTKTSLRHVTVNAMVLKDNKILLGKRGTFHGKPLLESGKWGLLGGYFDRNETLLQAIKRETMEESGWIIDNIQLFRINDSPKKLKQDRQNVDFIFTARGVKQTKTSDEEVTELKWFDLQKLPPKHSIAFDHGYNIRLYLKHLSKKTKLPILG